MKISARASVSVLALLSFLSSPQTALANDIPILTWEQGKLQSVVLGGRQDRSSWEVELVSSSGNITALNASTRNEENFVVFSVVIPRDIGVGSYTLFARGLSDENTKVAIVNIVEAKSYEIGRVPGDLIYIFVMFIAALSLLISLTRRKFSVTYLSSIAPRERFINGEPAEGFIQGVHNLGRLERIRIGVQQNLSEGVLGNLIKTNSSILHSRSRQLWATFPLMLAGLAIFQAGDSPSSFGYLFLLLCLMGNLDIFAGAVAAVAFVAIATFNTEAFSFGSILGFIFLASLFFLPNLLVQVLRVIFGSQINKIDWVKFVSVALVVHFHVLMQRSLLPESYLSTAEELLVLVVIIVALITCEILEIKGAKAPNVNLPLEEVTFDLALAPSRSSLFLVSSVVFSVIYVWSLKGSLALLVAFLAVSPILVSKVNLLRPGRAIQINLPRKLELEILIVCAATYLVFNGLSRLPFVTYSRMEALLVVGFVPVIVYSFYVALASSFASKAASVIR
jgi:hypothetical protein